MEVSDLIVLVFFSILPCLLWRLV